MPIHDWTRVNPGTFHDFHGSWITHIKESLNEGLLPAGYYAMAEQHFDQMVADVLTLHVGDQEDSPSSFGDPRAVAVAEAPPRIRHKMVAQAGSLHLRRTITVRRASNHRVVALIEIVFPANKDRVASLEQFVDKVWSALKLGVHVLVVDLFPPSTSDPNGLHGEIWKAYDSEPYTLSPEQPLTLVSYTGRRLPDAYIEPVAVGDMLVDMPLFLDPDWYINIPLEETYQTAWRGVPKIWRDVIDGGQSNAPPFSLK